MRYGSMLRHNNYVSNDCVSIICGESSTGDKMVVVGLSGAIISTVSATLLYPVTLSIVAISFMGIFVAGQLTKKISNDKECLNNII
tara:strand:- start:6082 stop:6339 length:258 start_codon:yes stop_codon:yes gene_type:complete